VVGDGGARNENSDCQQNHRKYLQKSQDYYPLEFLRVAFLGRKRTTKRKISGIFSVYSFIIKNFGQPKDYFAILPLYK
jgi:hypothetical protein